jgi:hypothetical protein
VHLVLNDLLYCDEVEFTLPRNPLSSGQTHASMDQNIRAILDEMHLELVDYDSVIRIPAGDKVVIRIRGKGCQDKHAR